MQTIGDVIKALFNVWKEMALAFISVFPKLIKVILWLACGVFIIPCIFIAGTLYPMWEEWGKEF